MLPMLRNGREEFKWFKMRLYNISFQSLRRKKTKTALLIFSLFLSVVSVLTLLIVSTEVEKNISQNLDEFGANILITPKSNELNYSYGGINLGQVTYETNSISEDELYEIQKIKNKKNISVIAPKLLILSSIGDKDVVLAGIKFDQEIRVKKWWKIIGSQPSKENEALAGYHLKNKFNLNINDTVTIENSKFIIAGFLNETGSQDDQTLFLSLPKVQALFNKEKQISLAEIAALCYDCPIEEIVSQTSQELPNAKVTALKQTIESKMTAVQFFKDFSYGVSAIIIIISVLMLFSSLNASLNERIKEIGIFRAIGFNSFDIIKLVVLEVFVSSLIAAVLASISSYWLADLLLPVLTGNSNSIILFDLLNPLWAILIAVFMAIISSMYPIYKALKLNPSIALRSL